MTAPQFTALLDLMGTDRVVMFSSDYPHWDYDAPGSVLPSGLPDPLVQRVMHLNAEETYALDGR